MSTPRGKHSHRCKICRSGVYCYKGGCQLPQRLDACAECRRTGRYAAPVVAREAAPAVVVAHAAPALKGWLAGSQVQALLDHPATRAYRKPKNANGSRGRYLFAYLSRRANGVSMQDVQASMDAAFKVPCSRGGVRANITERTI